MPSMVIEFNLKNLASKLTLLAVALIVCALLVGQIVSRFIIGTLADDRFAFERSALQDPVKDYPNSPRLNARLAEAELLESDRDLEMAERCAVRAVNLSPFDYRFRMTLAAVKEAEGNRAGAEQSLREALALAPNNRDVHWRLANLLLRSGKLAASVDEFRITISTNKNLLPATLDLIWRASRGNVGAVEAITGSDAKARLLLSQFLIKQSKVAEAANIFRSIDRGTRLAALESASVLNALVATDNLALARELWVGLIADGGAPTAPVWNGGFESDILKNFSQFDWTFGRSEFARLSIDSSRQHSGNRSLKIEFLGRDTTELKDEIKQLVILRPGARYRVECYAKSEGLASSEGPRLAVTDKSSNVIAQSEPVAAGSNDWKMLSVEFVAPKVTGDAPAVYVSVKRKPKYDYDEPTRGTVWFDDFMMKEQQAEGGKQKAEGSGQ